MMNEKQKEQFNLVMNVGRLISMITLTVFAVFGMSRGRRGSGLLEGEREGRGVVDEWA